MNKNYSFAIFQWLRGVILLVNLFLLVFMTKGQGSDVYFDRLTVRDGLSHSNVYAIEQDNYGYLWFGTQDGLNRYDGKDIRIFRNEMDDPNSLSSSNFGKILMDNSGYFWFGTFGGGIDRFDPKTNTFKNFSYHSNDPGSISNNQIIFIFQDSKGVIWFGTPDGGLNRYNSDEENFTRFQYDPSNPTSLSGNRAKCMCETPDGTLWVGTENGLNKFHRETETFQRFTHNPNDKNSLSGNTVQNMIANSDGSIWIALHDGGLNHFDVPTKTFTHYINNPNDQWSISDNKADCILRDSNGQLWIGTYEGGLNRYDPETGKFYRYLHDPNIFFSISSNRIEYLYEDNSKVLWIATRGGGLNKVDLKPKKFHNIKYSPNVQQGLPQHNIMAISSDKQGNLWIGTDGGGLAKFSIKTGKFSHLKRNPNNINSLSSNRVWSVHIDSEGIIWAGTYQGGLNRIEQLGSKYNITHYKHNPVDSLTISNNQINCIMEDSMGQLWIGTAKGLNKLLKLSDPIEYLFKSYLFSNYNKSFISNDNYVNSIVQDQNGKLWISSYQSGLFEFDPVGEKFNHFIPLLSDSLQFIRNLKALTIKVDSHNNFWVGTESGGVLNFDIENSSVTPHPNNSVLRNKLIIGVIEDNEENLWIVSASGLYKYSLNERSFRGYTFDDGIEAEGFNRNSFHKRADGKMFFGGNAALTFFNPTEVVNNPHIPNVAITDFKVQTQSIWSNKLVPYMPNSKVKDDVILKHKDNFFSIAFAAFDYTSPSQNQFQYKLEGFDKDWVDAGNSNSATYTNLSPGRYIFKVKGSNNDKVWNQTPVELKIQIKPPFWKHPWFIAMEVLLLILIIVFYIRYRTFRLRVDKNTLEKKVNERTNELNLKNEELESTLKKLKEAQMHLVQSEKMASVGVLTAGISHEINNPLNYIYGSISVIEKYINENLEPHKKELSPLIDIINEGVVRATKIVQSLDQFSRSSEVYTNFCDIHSIIDNCLLMLKQRMRDRVSLEKNFAEQLPLVLGNAGKLHQVFFNIIVNAVQSIDEQGNISISTSLQNDEVIVEVSDNGCGISQKLLSRITEPFFTTKDPGKGIGLGLSIAYSIINEHKGRMKFESEKGVGTTIAIAIPVKSK